MLCGIIVMALMGSSCAPNYELVAHRNQASAPGEPTSEEAFGYRRWLRKDADPDLILIGIHGFNGDSQDYENLAHAIVGRQPDTAVYAYNLRGQGSDPLVERRGDIGNPGDWYWDLYTFTQLVRERHPGAKIVWFGESMGGLIAAQALARSEPGNPPCDALVLSSPVVRIKDDVPHWKVQLVRVAAATVPMARVSLDALSGGEPVKMTATSVHSKQAKKNSYFVEAHTMRMLGTLTRLIDQMNECAATFQVPLLVLHGGKDYFNSDSDLRGFLAHVPSSVPVTYRNYPKAHHLLMYDEQRAAVFRDVGKFLEKVRRERL